MTPFRHVVRLRWRRAEVVAVGPAAQAEPGPAGIGEVWRPLCDTGESAVIETSGATRLGCSPSYASRWGLGDRAPAFEAALTEALLAISPAGRFHERLETEVIVARRAPDQ